MSSSLKKFKKSFITERERDKREKREREREEYFIICIDLANVTKFCRFPFLLCTLSLREYGSATIDDNNLLSIVLLIIFFERS